MALRFLSAGDSHGPGLSGIIEGLPAGLDVDLISSAKNWQDGVAASAADRASRSRVMR